VPFRLLLTSKFAKSAYMIKNTFFQKSNNGNKKIQFLKQILNPLKRLKKTREKMYQRNGYRKMEFFTFITVCQSFWPVTFLGELFTFFSTDSNSASNFAFYDSQIEF
jgi:hypothetical protein